MSAEFYDILAPPQTLESLDNWGELDSLPWPLDSDVWTNAGVYGLRASEGGASGGRLDGAQRVRTLALAGSATTGGTADGEKANSVLELEGRAGAESGGNAVPGLVCLLGCAGAAQGNGETDVARVIPCSGVGMAVADQSLFAEFKGWGWAREDKASQPAEWAAHSVPAQEWMRTQGGQGVWR